MTFVSGSTRVTLIIGHPIAQVGSPLLFNRFFAEHDQDAIMIPADILPERVGDFLNTLRGWSNADGCLVTVPHKRAVVSHLDELTERARRLQAVNVIKRTSDGRLIGDNVDGKGFLNAARKQGFDPVGRSALVVGCGGAGSAIADTLCDEGIQHLSIRDVDRERSAWLSGILRTAFPAVQVDVPVDDDLARFDLVVNASPVGMGSTDLPLSVDAIRTIGREALVADVVTKPAMTAFLRLAADGGRRVQQGQDMVAGQMELLGRFMGCFA